MDTAQRTSSESVDQVYDGFISYSHAADDLLAPRLQAGLQRFAKPWWKRRALRVFRDESSLSANPHLWSSITDALDTSGWFVLLLSPDAARSEWVNQEVAYWVEHRDPSRILPVLTDGELGWADGDVTGDAVPDVLRGVFADEPRWVDLRFAKGEEQLDLQDPRFADAVADIASAMRGVPKDELASEEVRQHRRTVRTAWAAGGLLLILAVVAGWAGLVSARNADQARAEQLAANSLSQVETDAERALLLALESLDLAETPNGLEAVHKALQAQRTLWSLGVDDSAGTQSYLHPGGRHLLVSVPGVGISYWATDEISADPLWEVVPGNGNLFASTAWFTPDAGTVTVALMQWSATGEDSEPEELGFHTYDLEDGSLMEVVPLDRCTGAVLSLDGFPEAGVLVAAWPEDLCDVQGVFTGKPSASMSYRADYRSPDAVVLDLPAFERWDNWPSISRDGTMVALSTDVGAYVVEAATGAVMESLPDGDFKPTISPDGSQLLVQRDGYVALRDLATLDVLRTFPGVFSEIAFSEDGASFIGLTFQQGVDVFDLDTGERSLSLNGPLTRPWDLSVVPDIGRIAVGSAEDVRLWDLAAFFGEVESPYGAVIPSPGIEFRPLRLEAGFLHVPGEVDGVDGYVVYDAATGEVVRERPGAWGASRISSAGTILEVPLLEADEEQARDLYGRPQVVEAASGRVLAVLPGTCPFWSNRVRPAAATFEAAGDCGPDDRIVPIGDAEFSADGTRIAIATWTREVIAYDLDESNPLWESDLSRAGPWAPDWSVAISGDGRAVAYYLPLDDSTSPLVFDIDVVEIDSGASRGTAVACNPSNEMDFIDNDSQLVIADWCSNVVVFDAVSLEQVQSLERGQGGALTDLAVSDDRYATTGYDGNVRVWDADLEKVILEVPFDVPIEFLDSVAFLDHDHLLVGFDDGSTVVLTLDVAELRNVAASRLTRGFTSQECSQYDLDPCPTLDELREG